jgi:preprotein translocase subunit SecG
MAFRAFSGPLRAKGARWLGREGYLHAKRRPGGVGAGSLPAKGRPRCLRGGYLQNGGWGFGHHEQSIPGFPRRFSREKTENSPLYKIPQAYHSPVPMTFAAINWLSISIDLLLVIFVIVCLLMILLILMQRPKQEGLGAAFGGGVTDQVFGARTTNVLQRGTVYLGSLFFILSLALAVLIGQKNKTISAVTAADTAPKVEEAKPEATPETATPKSLLEELPPAAPAPGTASPPVEIPATPESVPQTEPTPPLESAPPVEAAPPTELAPPADAPATPETGETPAGN